MSAPEPLGETLLVLGLVGLCTLADRRLGAPRVDDFWRPFLVRRLLYLRHEDNLAGPLRSFVEKGQKIPALLVREPGALHDREYP